MEADGRKEFVNFPFNYGISSSQKDSRRRNSVGNEVCTHSASKDDVTSDIRTMEVPSSGNDMSSYDDVGAFRQPKTLQRFYSSLTTYGKASSVTSGNEDVPFASQERISESISSGGNIHSNKIQSMTRKNSPHPNDPNNKQKPISFSTMGAMMMCKNPIASTKMSSAEVSAWRGANDYNLMSSSAQSTSPSLSPSSYYETYQHHDNNYNNLQKKFGINENTSNNKNNNNR